jgi:hypothetical protein
VHPPPLGTPLSADTFDCIMSKVHDSLEYQTTST